MIARRARFVVEYEVNLDSVPGWGHEVSDWEALAKSDVLRQTHYHTTAKTISVEMVPSLEQQKAMDELAAEAQKLDLGY